MSLIPKNQVNSILISENINSIINYYVEEHDILHEKISIYCELSLDEFETTLEYLKSNMPNTKFEYVELNKDFNKTCQLTDFDLSIIIPQNIFTNKAEIYEYNFQSHLKNIFGRMTFEKDLKSKKITVKNLQFVTTSIGE